MDLLNVSYGAPAAPQGPVAFQQPLLSLQLHWPQPMAPLQQQHQQQQPMMNVDPFGIGPPLNPRVFPKASRQLLLSILLQYYTGQTSIAAKQDDSLEARWELVAI